jgi:hypothetical protein
MGPGRVSDIEVADPYLGLNPGFRSSGAEEPGMTKRECLRPMQSDWMYLNAGWHTYAVGLQNDYAGGGCDHNLWFDYMVVHRY